MAKKFKVRHNSLYILESLRLANDFKKADVKTGESLSNYLTKNDFLPEDYEVNYWSFQTKKEFYSKLDFIKREVKERAKIPIIHLEMHGDKNGLQVGNYELVNWDEMNEVLISINVLCKNNLVLAFAACSGYWNNSNVIKLFQNGDRCPYIANLGPTNDIDYSEIKSGFEKFYKELFVSRNFSKAIKKMQEESSLFKQNSGDHIANRIIQMVEEKVNENNYHTVLKQFRKQNRKMPFPNKSYSFNLNYVKKHQSGFFKEELSKAWNRFMMIDLYEENRMRFRDFEEIWNSK